MFTKPGLILFGYRVVPDSHDISLQEMSLFHSRVEGTLSEVIWLARAHSAGITVWQNFRDMSFLLVPWTLWRKFALLWSIPSEVNHRHPYVNPPPVLPGSSLNPSYLKLWVLAHSSKPHPWAFGFQWSTVFPELLRCQLSADGSGCSYFLEPPFRTIFTLCPQNLTLLNNWTKGPKWGHIVVAFLKVLKDAQATRVETHTLVPFTHQSTSTLLNGIFCNREGTLSSSLSVCFYQPWVLASLLTGTASYSLEIMPPASPLVWGVSPQSPLTHMSPLDKAYVAWSKHQVRDSGAKRKTYGSR